MSSIEPPFSVSLIVATRGRVECLQPRIPIWKAVGFDEVIVVDGSYDPETRARVRKVCESHDATYVGAPVRLADTRSLSRNLGAKQARGSWIFFQDDDDDVPLSIDKDAIRRATEGRDWMAGPKGEIILWHRKEAFLAFGGYPEDMVAAEDWIMSNRARANGRGGPEPKWYEGTRTFPAPREDPISRVRNAYWYGLTLLLFLLRCPRRNEVILGDARRLGKQIRSAFGKPSRWLYVWIGLLARVVSPLYCVRVLLQSGATALRVETYVDWGEARPKPQ